MRQGFSSIVNYLTKPPFCQDGNARSSFFQRVSHNYPSLIQLFYMLRPRIIFQDAGRVQDFVYFLSNLGGSVPFAVSQKPCIVSMRCSGRAFRRGAWRGASVRWLGMAFRRGAWCGGRAATWQAASVRGCALVWTFRIVTLGSRSGTDFPARRPCADCPAALAACPQAARKAGKTPKGAAAKQIMQKTSLKRKRETLLLRLVVLLGSVFCADGC